MRTRLLAAVLCPFTLVMAACGGDDTSLVDAVETPADAPGADQSDDPSVDGSGDDAAPTLPAESVGTIEFEGVTYDLERVVCRDDQWDFGSPLLQMRISWVEDSTRDFERHNVSLDRSVSGEPYNYTDSWRQISDQEQYQPTVEVGGDSISASGVVWPSDASTSERDDLLQEFTVEARC